MALVGQVRGDSFGLLVQALARDGSWHGILWWRA